MQIKWILYDIATIIVSMFCLFPSVTASNPFRLLVLVAFFYVIAVSFRKLVIANKIPLFKIVFIFIISFIISYIIGINSSINFYIHFSILILFVIIFEQYRVRGLKTMKYAVFVLFGLLLIANLQTIIVLITNPSYARALTKNQDTYEVVGLSGGYGLVYASLLALIACLLLAIKKRKTSITFRLLLLLIISSSIVLIWKAGFFLALVLLIVGALIMIIGIDKRKIMKTLLVFVIMFGSLFIVKILFSDVVIYSTEGTKYETKVSEVLESDKDAPYNTDEFGERQNRYFRDFDLMIEYPIIGCWQFLLVGKHSFILDTLAQYGLLFGSYFLFTTFFIPIRILKSSEDAAFTQAVVFFGVLVIFLFLNTFAISMLPIVFVIFPYTNYLLQDK